MNGPMIAPTPTAPNYDPGDTSVAAPVPDLVNHPPHYTAHPSGVECIEITEHMGFNVGNAVKYLWRADEKGNALEDLKKAAWYVNREIARREKSGEAVCSECGLPGFPLSAAGGWIQNHSEGCGAPE